MTSGSRRDQAGEEKTMGNRAVITTEKAGPNDLGIYLHWNGGPESVLAFCEAAKQLHVRSLGTDGDPTYGFSRLTQIIGNFFGGTTSVGIGRLNQLDCDNYDNGLFRVNGKWELVSREHNRGNDTMTVAQLTHDQREKYEAILGQVLEANRPVFERDEMWKRELDTPRPAMAPSGA